jgi:hypothetical protein
MDDAIFLGLLALQFFLCSRGDGKNVPAGDGKELFLSQCSLEWGVGDLFHNPLAARKEDACSDGYCHYRDVDCLAAYVLTSLFYIFSMMLPYYVLGC